MRFDTVNRDRQVLQYIRDSIAARGYPPTLREIADNVTVHRSVAQRAVDRLVRDQEIEVDRGVARGIRVKRSTTHTRTEDLS